MNDYQPILSNNNVTKFIELCAWCDADKRITKEHIDKGYKASHGICEQHKNEVVTKYIKDYENQGFNITNDDNGSDGLPVVSGDAKE